MDVDSGDVSISAVPASDPKDQVSVERRLEWSGQQPTIDESWQGDTLRIRARCELNEFAKIRNDRCLVVYALRVPPDVALDVNLEFGPIRVDTVQGDLNLTAMWGDVAVANSKGVVRARTGYGTVTGTTMRSLEADVRSSSGDVSLTFAVPPQLVKATTDGGDVEVAVPRDAPGVPGYGVHPKVDGPGRSYISVPADSSGLHEVFATTSSGDVHVRYATG
jgi:hypothetical protein